MEILARLPDLATAPTGGRNTDRGPAVRGRAAVETAAASSGPSAAARRSPVARPAAAVPVARVAAEPTATAPVPPSAPPPDRRRRPQGLPAFPATSIVLLAVVAGLVWTAVTWRERGSVFRKSPPERWSQAFPAETATEETGRLR
jgi:hypothetical protein